MNKWDFLSIVGIIFWAVIFLFGVVGFVSQKVLISGIGFILIFIVSKLSSIEQKLEGEDS